MPPGLVAAGFSWLSFGKNGFPPEIDIFHKLVVTVLESLWIVQVVTRVVVQHLLGLARGCDIVLLAVRELHQERNWRCLPDEMNSVDVARGL
jgi:hypothetical protein